MLTDTSAVEAATAALPEVVLLELRHLRRDMDELVRYARGKAKTLLTVEEVAEEVGRAPYTVRNWIKNGKLKATRVDGTGPRGRLLVRREDVEALVEDAGRIGVAQ